MSYLFYSLLVIVHPETPDDTSLSFQFINEKFASSRSETRSHPCGAGSQFPQGQEIPQIDPPEAEKRAIYGWKLVTT